MALLEEYLLKEVHTSWCNQDPFADLGSAVRQYMAHYDGLPLERDPAYKDKKGTAEDASVQEGIVEPDWSAGERFPFFM